MFRSGCSQWVGLVVFINPHVTKLSVLEIVYESFEAFVVDDCTDR